MLQYLAQSILGVAPYRIWIWNNYDLIIHFSSILICFEKKKIFFWFLKTNYSTGKIRTHIQKSICWIPKMSCAEVDLGAMSTVTVCNEHTYSNNRTLIFVNMCAYSKNAFGNRGRVHIQVVTFSVKVTLNFFPTHPHLLASMYIAPFSLSSLFYKPLGDLCQ